MKNVYELRKEKNLFFILPDNNMICNGIDFKASPTAVIVNLYYIDDLDWYLGMLSAVPSEIDVYIVSSDRELLNRAAGRGYHLLWKENRGRDISALLVACKDIVSLYEYVCFLHDKKAIGSSAVDRIRKWTESLWGNTIRSADYITSVIGGVFAQNPSIGVLSPPEPSGEECFIWGKDLWRRDYEQTKELCKELGLTCDLNPAFPPLTIGTVLWFRSAALGKLFEYDWEYEDFDEEPLPSDGTISHAIERCFAYVAQDAGYDTGTIMSASYAAGELLSFREGTEELFEIVKDCYGIINYKEATRFNNQRKRFSSFCSKYGNIYLYGAGKIGKRCIQILNSVGIVPQGIIVSKKTPDMDAVEGIPVISLDEIRDFKDTGIIISVGVTLNDEIERILADRGIVDYVCYAEGVLQDRKL